MDNERRQRSSYSSYTTQTNPYQSTPYTPSSGAGDRQQPGIAAQSPTLSHTAGRTGSSGGVGTVAAAATGGGGGGGGGASGGYGYGGYAGEGNQFVGTQSMQTGTLQYTGAATAGFGQQEQRAASSQYSQYGGATGVASGMMYNVAAAAQQHQHQHQQQAAQQQSGSTARVGSHHGHQQHASPQSPYDTVPSVQHYAQPRQSAAIEVLTSQFGVPHQYYVSPGEGTPGGGAPGPTPAPTSAHSAGPIGTQQYQNLQYTSQQSPVGRADTAGGLVSTFSPTGMANPSAPQDPQGQFASQTAYTTQSNAPDHDQAYVQYQQNLKQTFEYIRDGRLSEAGRNILSLSDWLVQNAEGLGTVIAQSSTEGRAAERLTTGLVRDDQALHAERLKLWEEFNHCWLTTFQRQKEMTQELLQGREPQLPASLLEYEFMETMARELIRLCDHMEKHGLVDYQMGIWEEEIIASECSNTSFFNYMFKLLTAY
jgi:hypothetical protein